MPAANAISSDEIVVGADGRVRVAPVGTTVPVDFSVAYTATWVDLGYTSEDGVSFAPNVDTTEIMAWQSFRPVRRLVTARSEEVSFTLLQWSRTTVPFAFGGGAVATTGTAETTVHRYTPPSPAALDYRAMVITWEDGAKKFRLVIPKGLVTSQADTTLNRTDSAGLGITFSPVPDGVLPGFYLDSNDASFAAT
jgi:hypothetical protein